MKCISKNWLVVLLFPLLLLGCDGIIGGAGEQSLLDRIQESRDLWEAQEVDTYNYSYVLGTLAQEGPETDVYVVDGVIDSVAIGGEAAHTEDGLTVEDVFDRVEDAVQADSDQFEMGFHPEHGYTERYAVLYTHGDQSDSDVYEVLSFESDQLDDDDNGNGNGDDS